MILIDTDIFVIERLFKNDKRYTINKEFLISEIEGKCTSIFNLFELLGIASFNLNSNELKKLFKSFPEIYDMKVLYPITSYESAEAFIEHFFENTFEKISLKMNLMDAIILNIAQEHNCSTFVTWNLKHFIGRTDIPVKTPEQILAINAS